jgi:hypothetical protein
MQTRSMSAVEAATNTLAGFLVSLALTFTVLPSFGYKVTAQDAWGITAIYTAASVIRSYLVRRLFNGQR